MKTVSPFEQQINDKSIPVVRDFTADSRIMLIAFGGVGGKLAMPPFEFFNITSGFGIKKIFVRDVQKAWYHHGLPGVGTTIAHVVEALEKDIAAQSVERLVICGNSMGGYAAILFGLLLGADIVLAFSPQTFIGKMRRFLHRDSRWNEEMKKLHSSERAQRNYFDLRAVFRRQVNRKTIFHIYYNRCEPLDLVHARRLQEMRNVFLHARTEGGHTLVRHLRDSGLLREILLDSLSTMNIGNSSAGR